MKVRTIIGAQRAYACIDTGLRVIDIRLEPGRSAAQSLREFADEQKAKADLSDLFDKRAHQLKLSIEQTEALAKAWKEIKAMHKQPGGEPS